jgi:hypothetical protein
MNSSAYSLALTLSNFLSDVTELVTSPDHNIGPEHYIELFDFLSENRDDLTTLSDVEGEGKRRIHSNLETLSYIMPNLRGGDVHSGIQIFLQHFLNILTPDDRGRRNNGLDRLWPLDGSYHDHAPRLNLGPLEHSEFLSNKADLTLNLANWRKKIHPNSRNPFIN